MKDCPFCGEQIQDDAVKCRFCREMLSANDVPALPSPERKKPPKSRPLFSPGTKTAARKALSGFSGLCAFVGLVDINKTELVPGAMVVLIFSALAVWSWPKAKDEQLPETTAEAPPLEGNNKAKGGCADRLGKGCLGLFLVFLLMILASNLIETHSLTMKIEPGANALIEVEGPVSSQERGGEVILHGLLKGSYTFKVTAQGYKTYRGAFEIPKNKNLAISLTPDNESSPKQQVSQKNPTPKKRQSPSNDPNYPIKLVSVLAENMQFGGMQCGLQVQRGGWHKSNLDGRWNAVLRRSFGSNEVSCLLESDDQSSVQRIELEAEFYEPGLYKNEMLLQFGQSAQVLMHPEKPPEDFSQALVNMTGWSNGSWEMVREEYANGGFGLVLRKK